MKKTIDRREFIVAGSLAAAALSLPSVGFAAPKTTAPSPLGLSLGFLGEASGNRLVAADSLLSGDPTLFSRGARFSFNGMQRFGGEAMVVAIDVIYQTVVGDLPFFAFTHGEQKKSFSNSSRVSFVVPVPTTGAVNLSVKAKRASSGDAQSTVSFAVNSTREKSLKLNQGTYIYAITDRAVDWSSIRLADGVNPATYVSGKELLLRAQSLQNVTFDYIVMTVRAAAAAA